MDAQVFPSFFPREMAYTIGLGVFLTAVASLAATAASKHQGRESTRFWVLTFRNVAAVCFIMGLFVIWRSELQSVFLALGAATAGFLLAFRETWLSLVAFWARFVKRQYGLNDFIEVDSVRGRVIDITWLTTIVAEGVPGKDGTIYSGKLIHIPNNRMLLSPVTVDNLSDDFTLHIVTVPLPPWTNPMQAEQLLLEVATELCEQYFEEGGKHLEELARATDLDISSEKPKAFLSFGEKGSINIHLRIFVPAAVTAKLHQKILHAFFARAGEGAWPKVRSTE